MVYHPRIPSSLNISFIYLEPDCFIHPGRDLIPNHDFETGTDGWTVQLRSNGGNIVITNSTSTEGYFSGVLSSEIVVETTFNIPPG